jgi:hypothetical protein
MAGFLVVLILLAGCGVPRVDSKTVAPRSYAYSGFVLPVRPVPVKDCSKEHALKNIYADAGLTIPMANPLLPDSNGDFTLFTTGCVVVGDWETEGK